MLPVPPAPDEFVLAFHEAAAKRYKDNPAGAEFASVNAVLKHQGARLVNTIENFFNIVAATEQQAKAAHDTLLQPRFKTVVDSGYRKPGYRQDIAPPRL